MRPSRRGVMLDPDPGSSQRAVESVAGHGDRSRIEVATQILTGLALLATLNFHLLASLLAGLLVYELVHLLAPSRYSTLVRDHTAKVVAVAFLAVLVASAIGAGILGLVAVLSSRSDNLPLLLRKIAEVIESLRSHLPPWVLSFVPEETEELKAASVNWLRENAGQLRSIGQDVSQALVHIIFGLIIGGMVAVSRESTAAERGPLVIALSNRLRLIAAAFRNVVFAQVRISALNTTLTAIYLLVIVPRIGIPLPLTKTMVAVTFLAGLLPVIGNLISNTMIVLISLSASPTLALVSLAFLVIIHKLEYFVNARIMGGQIHARAWEVLTAMLVMEAVFGIPGLVAAPIFYAYLKAELSLRRLI